MEDSNEEAISVKTNTLTKEAKILRYFVSIRFMPSLHLSDVTQDRAILIYCIVTGRPLMWGVLCMHLSYTASRDL